MKIKNRFSIPIALLIIMALTGYLLWDKNSEEVLTSVDPLLQPIKQELLELQEDPEFQKLSKAQQREKTNTVLDKIPDTYRSLTRQYKLAMSALPEIKFYARMMDQYGQPVSNASVWYSGENAYLASGGGQGRAVTDVDGYLVIETTGAALSLGAVTHPGIDNLSYDRPDRLTSTSTIGKITAVRLTSTDANGSMLNYKNYQSRETAFIIQAWRYGEKYAGAIDGIIRGYYDADGSDYTLEMYPIHKNNYPIKGISKGQLKVSCIRPHMEGIRDYGDWQVSITPINGGLQKTDDLYMNLAPESGYEPSLEIDMQIESGNFRPHLRNERYYFTANNGKEYGSLDMKIEPFRNSKKEACVIDIRYRINPTGSRNLELSRR